MCCVIVVGFLDRGKFWIVRVPFGECRAFVFGPRDVVVDEYYFVGMSRAFELTG